MLTAMQSETVCLDMNFEELDCLFQLPFGQLSLGSLKGFLTQSTEKHSHFNSTAEAFVSFQKEKQNKTNP